MKRTTTIAALLLAIPCVGTAQATTKADKAQNKLIKKLQQDVKVLSGRIKSDRADFVDFYSCLLTYDVTNYGNNLELNTDGYTYTTTDGVTFQTNALAPTDAGDTPTASLLVYACSSGARVNGRVFRKSSLFTPPSFGPAQNRTLHP